MREMRSAARESRRFHGRPTRATVTFIGQLPSRPGTLSTIRGGGSECAGAGIGAAVLITASLGEFLVPPYRANRHHATRRVRRKNTLTGGRLDARMVFFRSVAQGIIARTS